MIEDFCILFKESQPFAYVLLGVFSLVVGSFLNVVIYRLPIMLSIEERFLAYEVLKISPGVSCWFDRFNLFLPRSHCAFCKNTISNVWNIPLVSFLILRGRCKYCKHRISWIYPVVESLSLILSILACYSFGFGFSLLFILPFIWLLICLSLIDVKVQLLPDGLTYSLLWLGLLANNYAIFTSLSDAVIAVICGYLSLWIFIKIYYLLTGKVGMGSGDFKLFAALGAWFGLSSLTFILILSASLGIICGYGYLLFSNKSKDTPIPFGPFLCIAACIYLFLKYSN